MLVVSTTDRIEFKHLLSGALQRRPYGANSSTSWTVLELDTSAGVSFGHVCVGAY